MGARVVICRNGRVGIIVRLQFGDRPPNLCSDRQETSHNDRWTSSGITFPPQNCHYIIALHSTPQVLKRYNDHLFIDPFKGNICYFAGTEGQESPCWLGLIRPMSLLTSYWSRQLLIIVSIFQMSLFPEVRTNGTPAPRRSKSTAGRGRKAT